MKDPILPLLYKALAVAQVPGRPYDFRCPICGGAAHAIKSTFNSPAILHG